MRDLGAFDAVDAPAAAYVAFNGQNHELTEKVAFFLSVHDFTR